MYSEITIVSFIFSALIIRQIIAIYDIDDKNADRKNAEKH